MKPGRFIFALLLLLVVWQLAYAQNSIGFQLIWDPVPMTYTSPLDGYNVYRGTQPGQTTLLVAAHLTYPLFTDINVNKGIRYYYTASAMYADGEESARSNEVSSILSSGGGCN